MFRKRFFICWIVLLVLVPDMLSQAPISFEMYLGDTVNRIYPGNIKQGRWVFYGKDKKGKKYKSYKQNQVVEDGFYVNNRKNGLWRTYHPSGKLQSEIIYKDDVYDGQAKIFNEEGKPVAEGFLTTNGFSEKYVIYDKNLNKIYKTSGDSRRSGTVRFYGEVIHNNKPLSQVKVSVELSGVPVFTFLTSSNGFFDIYLDLQPLYHIRFEKEGYNEEVIEINADTRNPSDTSTYEIKKWTLRMTDNLVNTMSTEFLHLLLNKPSNRIYFNKRKKKFVSDGSYINVFTKQFRGINQTTKMLLAQAADDNKRLEIENLRMQSEKKEAEILALMKEQQLKEAELKKKEAEIM